MGLYSAIWKMYSVEWKDNKNALVLTICPRQRRDGEEQKEQGLPRGIQQLSLTEYLPYL